MKEVPISQQEISSSLTRRGRIPRGTIVAVCAGLAVAGFSAHKIANYLEKDNAYYENISSCIAEKGKKANIESGQSNDRKPTIIVFTDHKPPAVVFDAEDMEKAVLRNKISNECTQNNEAPPANAGLYLLSMLGGLGIAGLSIAIQREKNMQTPQRPQREYYNE